MGSSDRHHYIPIFYLTQWASGNPLKLWQMMRGYEGNIGFKHNTPASMGYQDELYAMFNVGDGLKNWLEENFFRIVDNDASLALQELLADNLNLRGRLRNGWSRFLMSLMCRTPFRIEYIRGAYDRELPDFRASLEEAFDIDNVNVVPRPTLEERRAAIDQQLGLSVGG